MLKQRIMTALLLLLILLPALFYVDPTPFCLLALLFIAAAAWEWGRLNGLSQLASLCFAVVNLILCGWLWSMQWLTHPMHTLWLWSGALWVALGAWILRSGVTAWSRHSQALRLIFGMLALILTWLAVAQAKLIGTNFLLSVLALVWSADIGAYFAGRAFGGRFIRSKLALSISPGKSWEGVWGGMLTVLLLAFAWQYSDAHWTIVVPSFYTQAGRSGWFFLVTVCVFMSAMSVVGDLLESLVKRSAGAKDSSGLLPGHGGVLDRIDALLPTLPLAMMFNSF
jgi:phosphatidate cytidylyltransferase